jgi:beta-galactosidase/beta-glucuronidase
VVVSVDEGGAAQLLVNGQPQVIRGMGLNTQYTRNLTPAQRAARLDADFAALRSMGVNTVLGWDPNEFDRVLLDHAEDHGLGVVMPFDIDPATDFTDPGIRAQLTRQVLDWVNTYRAHPAVRMWGIGNEVLHKIVHPVWLGGPQDPERVQQARAFVDWTIETADAVHALDPDHPVTYRDAEDAFANWMVEGLHRHGLAEARMWFLWGVNCYTNRLDQIENNWPNVGMESPMWVSEFAPGGLAIPDRPDGFESMWGTIRQHAAWTLGGAAYAWTRNGPEGVDRNLGLTDDGVPVDGRSLERLAQLYRADSH